jgi:5-methylcytosine-specific restriction endonuclease McrA
VGNALFRGHRARVARENQRRKRLPCCICGQPIDYTLPASHPMSFTLEHRTAQHLAPELVWDRTNHGSAHRRCNAQKGTTDGSHLKPLPRSRDW